MDRVRENAYLVANDKALSGNGVSEQTQVDYIHNMEHGKTITHGK